MAKWQGFSQGIFTQSSSQKEELGRTRWWGDRMFAYAKAGAVALAAGKLTIGTAPVTGHKSGMVCAAAAIGATQVTVTPVTADVTVDQYKDGYLWFPTVAGTGYGMAYRIATHPAATATNTLNLDLREAIKVAITASTTGGMVPNPQAGVVILPGATVVATAHVAGVPPIAVNAGYYFWNQVKGPIPLLINGTCVLGNAVIADWTTGSGIAGACIPVASAGSVADAIKGGIIGVVVDIVADTGFPLVNLDIAGY